MLLWQKDCKNLYDLYCYFEWVLSSYRKKASKVVAGKSWRLVVCFASLYGGLTDCLESGPNGSKRCNCNFSRICNGQSFFSLENSWWQLQLSGRWRPVCRRKYRPVDDERWFTDETNWCRFGDKLVRCWCESCLYITQQLPYKSTKIVPYKNTNTILDECLTQSANLMGMPWERHLLRQFQQYHHKM